jgi:predicted ATPase
LTGTIESRRITAGKWVFQQTVSAVAPVTQQQLEDALAQLARAELIFQRGTQPDAQYTWKHALMQDAAYSTLLRERRKQLHGRIVAVLEGQFPEITASEPARLAQHCAEAALTEKAINYWLQAGQQAVARSAMAEAISLLRKGIELLTTLEDNDARRQRELDLQIALGWALRTTQGHGAKQVGEVYARARGLCEQLNTPSKIGPVLHGLWTHHFTRAEHLRANELATEILNLGERYRVEALKLMGVAFSGMSNLFRGEFAVARAFYEQWLGFGDRSQRRSSAMLQAEDPDCLVRTYLAQTLCCMGYLDQARHRQSEALERARQLAHAHTLAFVLAHGLVLRIGSPRDLLKDADEVLAITAEQNFPIFEGVALIIRGSCLSIEGQKTNGVQLMLEGKGTVLATGTLANIPSLLVALAEAYGRAAQPEEGLDQVIEAARLLDMTQERWAEAEVHRVQGALLSALDKHAAAEVSYNSALAVARHQKAKFWELRASTSLARLWRDQGKRTEARDLLAPIYGWFTEGFDTPDLTEAKRLLDDLSDTPIQASSTRAGGII